MFEHLGNNNISFNLLGFELVIFPDTTLDDLTISREEFTFTIPLIFLPETNILFARFLIVIVTETFEFTLLELSLVYVTTFTVVYSISEFTFTVLVVFRPVTFVCVTVSISILTLAVSLTILDFTFINTTRSVGEFSLSAHDTILPFTFIVVILFLGVVVGTLILHIFKPFTNVLVTILIGQSTLVGLLIS